MSLDAVAVTPRDFVVQDLLQLFRSRSANPAVIDGETSNVRHLCGYDGNPAGWRALSETITFLPHVHSYHFRLRATDMDNLATIAQIADALINSKKSRATFKASARTGKAQFLALNEFAK